MDIECIYMSFSILRKLFAKCTEQCELKVLEKN